jgi:hypothetical protein
MKKFNEWVKGRALKGKIAHLAKTLQNLIATTSLGESAQEESLALWSDPNFLKWLRSRGVTGQPTHHVDGGVGRAYFIGDKVVKFTDNRVEGNVANMVAGNPKSPTRIISVYRFKPKPIWAILQHKVDMDLPKMIKDASDILMAYVDDTGIDEFPEDRHKMAHDAAVSYNRLDLEPFILEMISVLYGLYRNTGFFHDDAVPGNIGVHGGKVVIPDLGPNKTKYFNARKSLDKIHDRRGKLGLPSYSEI